MLYVSKRKDITYSPLKGRPQIKTGTIQKGTWRQGAASHKLGLFSFVSLKRLKTNAKSLVLSSVGRVPLSATNIWKTIPVKTALCRAPQLTAIACLFSMFCPSSNLGMVYIRRMMIKYLNIHKIFRLFQPEVGNFVLREMYLSMISASSQLPKLVSTEGEHFTLTWDANSMPQSSCYAFHLNILHFCHSHGP